MRSKSAVGHQIRVALKRIGTLGIGWESCKRVTKGAGGERRKRKGKRGERFQALESFLRANTDLSTRRHSWKRNLIREKLNSFKCTSRSLFASYLPSPAYTVASLFVSLLPPSIRSLQPSERPSRFPPPLSTLAPFNYPLILIVSQPFSLRKRRSAIHFFSSSFFLSFPPLPPLSLSPLSLALSLPLFLLSFFFYALFKDVPLPC